MDEIIVFVNKIVKIVHECSKHWEGSPNKNFGDKYLITWKLPPINSEKQKTETKGLIAVG